MDAGRELDALIAVTLFGWEWKKYPPPTAPERPPLTLLVPPAAPNRIRIPNNYDRVWQPSDAQAKRFEGWDECYYWDNGEAQRGFPYYSTDIAAAWLVIAALRENRRTWVRELKNIAVDLWECQFVRYTENEGEFGVDRYYSGRVEGAPLAICIAALKAVGYESEDTDA